MLRPAFVLIFSVQLACGSVEHSDDDFDSGPGGSIDAAAPAADAAVTPACSNADPFESVEPVPGVVNSGDEEHNAWLSADERTIVFTRWPAGEIVGDFFLATRDSPDGAFGDEEPVSVNSGQDEWRAWLTDDLKTIYFDRRQLADSSWQILVATRSSTSVDFGAATAVDNVSDPDTNEFDPFVTASGMYFGRRVDTNIQILFAPAQGDGFGEPSAGIGVNSAVPDEMPVPSADGRALYFGADTRGGGDASWDVWLATRDGGDGPFDDPERLAAPVNSDGREYPSWLSPDNCKLYFTSDSGGDHDIWVAVRSPQ